MSKSKTLFEQAGYTRLTKFKVIDNGCNATFSVGDIIQLYDDDGTDSPAFVNQRGDTCYFYFPTYSKQYCEVYTEGMSPPPHVFKVGDSVVIKSLLPFCEDFVKLGQVAEIVSIGGDGDLWLAYPKWPYGQACSPKDVSPVLEETSTVSVQPEQLITIVKDVTYSVSIKNTLFTFTQDELDELIDELLGFASE